MKIIIVGTGYVGLVTGACFAEMGNSVTCVDINKDKVKNLKKGVLPIYEPTLSNIVSRNYKRENLMFITNIKSILKESNICFICVGTPMNEDGSADLAHVLSVAKSIGKSMQQHMYIIDKSTVPVGTADKVREVVQKELNKRKSNLSFDVISNPEFLKEGSAVSDFMKPDRIVVGAENKDAMNLVKDLYAPFTMNHDKFMGMDIKSAEMTKYAANAMLATKISFINEISNICERVGADVNKVRLGIGSDSRIGYSFIYPGCGYGGSCFPKDVRALEKTALEYGYEPKLIKSVEAVNNAQKMVLVNKIIKKYGNDLTGKQFGIWGLSFKPETDDMREASSITIINELTKRGANVKAYDPKAMVEAKDFYLKNNKFTEYVDFKYDALNNVDAMLLLTEWKEFRSPDFSEIAKRMKHKTIFDGRNLYNAKTLNKEGFEYNQIGVKN